LVLLYLPDLDRWVIKAGHTDSGLAERIKGLDQEYKVNRSQFFVNKVPRIIPLCIATCTTLTPPKRVEKAFRDISVGLTTPIKRGNVMKRESGVEYAEMYDRYLEFCSNKVNKCKMVFESDACLVDPDYIKYNDISIST
jgi:hypothetical protein